MKFSYEHVLHFNLVDKEDLGNKNWTFPIDRLTDVILDKIVSNIRSEDLLNLLAVHPSLASRCFTMKTIEINPSLDSIRLCMVARPNMVEEIKCVDMRLAPRRLQNVMREHYWGKLLSSTSLTKLTTDDIAVLRGTQLSSTLTHVKIEDEVTAYSQDVRSLDMNGINFPPSVTNFCLNAIGRCFNASYFRPPSDNQPRGNLFFDISRHFPSLTSLEISPCPCREFWETVDDRFFENIENLSIHAECDSFFPFSLVTNLKTLVFSGCRPGHLFPMYDAALDSLTAVAYRGGIDYPIEWINGRFAIAAPNLKYLFVDSRGSGPNRLCFHRHEEFLGRLHYFQARYWAGDMQCVLCLIPAVKCFDIFCDLKVRIDEPGGLCVVDESEVSLLKSKVVEHGGRVEIRYVHGRPPTVEGVPIWFCRVRVINDVSFDCENVIRNYPFFSA